MKVKGRSYYSPENTLTNRRFIYPNFFFDLCVAEIVAFSWTIVLMGKALYQSAFFEFRKLPKFDSRRL